MNKTFFIISVIFLVGSFSIQSCKREGCTNSKASNYDSKAKTDDGSCIIYGCANPRASNYDSEATNDDGSCIIYGCTNPSASNYDSEATNDDGSCIIYGCTNPSASNYNPQATNDDGSCIIYGCTDPSASNYNPQATNDDGSCVYQSPTGEAMFWTDADYGTGNISVYVSSSYVGQITHFYPSGTPNCGTFGCVTIERDIGLYSFYAESQNGIYWNGSVTITNGGCYTMRLYVSKSGRALLSGDKNKVDVSKSPIVGKLKSL